MHTAKILTSIIVLLALVIAGSTYTLNTLAKTSENLSSHISQLEDSVKATDWNKAVQELSEFEASWSKTNRTWEMLLDHIEIDNIDNSLVKLSKYLDARDQALTLGEAASLKQYILHIPEKEKLSLNNLL